MAVAFKAVGTENTEDDNSAAATITVNFPTNVEGDFLIAIISCSNGTPNLNPATNITAPSPWVEVLEASTGAATAQQVFFAWRFSPAGGLTTVDFSTAADTGYVSHGVVYTGVDTSQPIDVFLAGSASAGSTTNDAPRPTTLTANTMVIRFMVRDVNVAITHPASTNERIDASQVGPGNGISLDLCDETQAAIAQVTARQFSWTGSEENISATVVLREVQSNFKLEGDVRDLSLDTVGTVRCFAMKHDNAAKASRKFEVKGHANANGSGLYSITGLADNDARYCVAAYNDEATDRRGVTDTDLTPVAE